MERIAFTLLFLGLLTGSAFAKDTEGTWKYRTYLNGVIMVDHEGQTYTGNCQGTTMGGFNTPVREIEGCKDAEGFAGDDYQRAAAKIDGCSA